MSLLKQWREVAYSEQNSNGRAGEIFWGNYFAVEKGIYEKLLTVPVTKVEGTVKELSEKYEADLMIFVGFLDGINDSLKTPNPIEEMDESTYVTIDIELELLYKNMVGAKAEWLYELKEWDELLTESKRKELFLEEKKSNTVVKGDKIQRNDPCPCGSGKKYKKCCGNN